jgi:hypothetical protein
LSSRAPVFPKQAPTEFASLPLARAYIDNLRQSIRSFGACQAIDALDRLDRVYQEFPELTLEHHGSSCSSLVTSSLEQITQSDGRSSLSEALHVLSRFRELRWDAVEPVVSILRQQGRTDTILQIFSKILDRVTFGEEDSPADFGDILKYLLADKLPLEIDSGALAAVVRSVRRRLRRPSCGRHEHASTRALLAMAERFSVPPPPKASKPHTDRPWPSGRLSFDEFLLQWPCEIELAGDLDDAAFIGEAHRAILLREPDVTESDQYLWLLRDGVSREWIIEDMLTSEELRSLDRRLRVVCGGRVITEPGNSGAEDMPAVTWPSRSVG